MVKSPFLGTACAFTDHVVQMQQKGWKDVPNPMNASILDVDRRPGSGCLQGGHAASIRAQRSRSSYDSASPGNGQTDPSECETDVMDQDNSGRIVETAVEARQGELGPGVLMLLDVSGELAVLIGCHVDDILQNLSVKEMSRGER
ncbi:hypothetical protein [Bradyrhizobium sp. Bra78]|uniref:hypothetical protein n=2 Tax=Nitrobacteraceae TaxID=41294 RepID=UPI0021CA2336|nr:hypothetical protein [Bradyrhizobium sp. Bra78]